MRSFVEIGHVTSWCDRKAPILSVGSVVLTKSAFRSAFKQHCIPPKSLPNCCHYLPNQEMSGFSCRNLLVTDKLDWISGGFPFGQLHRGGMLQVISVVWFDHVLFYNACFHRWFGALVETFLSRNHLHRKDIERYKIKMKTNSQPATCTAKRDFCILCDDDPISQTVTILTLYTANWWTVNRNTCAHVFPRCGKKRKDVCEVWLHRLVDFEEVKRESLWHFHHKEKDCFRCGFIVNGTSRCPVVLSLNCCWTS